MASHGVGGEGRAPGAGGIKLLHPVCTFDGSLGIGGIRPPRLVWAFDGDPRADRIRPSYFVGAIYGGPEAGGNKLPRPFEPSVTPLESVGGSRSDSSKPSEPRECSKQQHADEE